MIRAFLILLSGLYVTSAAAEKPVLALVIDDLGYSFDQARQVLNLPGQHTYAIIPSTTYAKKIAQFAYQNGREVILHMPMQSAIGRKIEASVSLAEHYNDGLQFLHYLLDCQEMDIRHIILERRIDVRIDPVGTASISFIN